jgi:hypothetical protein
MIHKDEKISSSMNGESGITLVTFIGFQEHLVINFLKTYIQNGVKEVLMFTSVPPKSEIDGQMSINIEIRKKSVNLIRDALGDRTTIKFVELENIWDFQEYYFNLSRFPIESAILNISAGPAVFSAAGMIWALEHGHSVSYSVEYHNNVRLISSVFALLDLRPYINSIFSTDNVDRMVMSALKNGRSDSLQIHEYVKSVIGFKISLRSIEIHINKLHDLGIVEITRGRVNKISFSQKWSKIGALLRKQ